MLHDRGDPQFTGTLEISTGSQRLRDFRFPELGSAALPTGDYSSPPPDGKFVVSIASVTDSLGNWVTPALLRMTPADVSGPNLARF